MTKTKYNSYARKWHNKNKIRVNKNRRMQYAKNPSYFLDKTKKNICSDWKPFLLRKLISAKHSDNKKGLKNNIDTNYLLKMLVKQNYRCARTGIQMTHILGDLHSVSIDRINNTKGHMKKNIQLVCQFYNLGKRNRTEKEARAIIKEIQKHGDII